MLVAGVDSSTQSTKVILCDAADGTVVGRGSAPHPAGTECDPASWWEALQKAGDGLLTRAAAVGVAGQQHGMIVLDEAGRVIRPALLWNDLRSAPEAAQLLADHGGPGWWAEQTGSVPAASFTVTKLRWLARHEPEHAAATSLVLLPHDWLTWRLGAAEPGTDRGDASGTGYFSPASSQWLTGLAQSALGHQVRLPRLAGPAETVGQTRWGAAISAGTGDNMGAALGLALEPGDVAVSIGTSGTAYTMVGPQRVARGYRCGAARHHGARKSAPSGAFLFLGAAAEGRRILRFRTPSRCECGPASTISVLTRARNTASSKRPTRR